MWCGATASHRGRLIFAGGTGLYLRAALGDLDVPGQFPNVRRKLDADPDTAGLHRRLRQLDPVAAGRMEPDQPPAGGAGPRGDDRQRPAVLLLRSRD